MGIVISLINIVGSILGPLAFPLKMGVDGAVALSVLIVFVVMPNNFINWGQVRQYMWENLVPDFLKGPIEGIMDAFLFMKNLAPKEGFVSSPVKYKKHLNNDGGIGWVPYYGKPGRLCKEDKDCPTFQKCKKEKCVIPMGVY